MAIYFIYIVIGLIGGLLVGLIGGGIGPIVVPTLIPILLNQGIDYNAAVHLAIGTSLCIVIVTTSISMIGYHFSQVIYWPILKRLLPGTLLGSTFGSTVAALLSGKILQFTFGMFLIFIAIFILKTRQNELIMSSKVNLPHPFKLTLISALLSLCSTILGISDGLLLVPFLKKYKMPMRDTIAIATVCAFSASIVGAVPFFLIGYFDKNLPSNTFSYIYFPALIIIASVTFLSTPLGVNLNKKLSENKLKTIFSVFLFIVGLKMLLIL